MTERIDFDSRVPYYIQLMGILKEQMQQGRWHPEQQIPGEQELCSMYGISRTVVRQTLREMEVQGIISRRKGKGTFVSSPKINEGLVQKLAGFYDDTLERGFKPTTQILHRNVIPAPPKVAGFLGIEPGESVVDLLRLRSVNGEPLQLVTSYVPLEICPALAEVDLTNRSLYHFMEAECGIFIAKGRRSLEAVSANETEAEVLGVARGAPLLMLESVSYTENGQPVEYYHALHRGDRSRFEVELFRIRETATRNGAHE